MNLTKTRVYQRRIYKSGSGVRIGPMTARYLMLLLLAVFSLLFLVQTAEGSDKALQLRQEEAKQQQLRQELTTLEVQSSRLQSLQNLSQSPAAQGMIPIGEEVPVIIVQP